MRRIRDPQQKWMFDPFDGVLSEMARQCILTGWQGIFRTVVLCHAAGDDAALPEELRARYAPSEGKLFAEAKDADARTRSRQQVAEDMLLVIERFAGHGENDVQLITGAIPETACANDSEAVRPMLEQLNGNGLTPEQMAADTA